MQMNTKHPSWSGLSTYPLNFPTPATALHSAPVWPLLPRVSHDIVYSYYYKVAVCLKCSAPSSTQLLLLCMETRQWTHLRQNLSPNPNLICNYCSRKVQKNSSTKENLSPTLTGSGAEKQEKRIYKKYNGEKNLKYHYENLQREREYTAPTKKDIVLYFVEEERE